MVIVLLLLRSRFSEDHDHMCSTFSERKSWSWSSSFSSPSKDAWGMCQAILVYGSPSPTLCFTISKQSWVIDFVAISDTSVRRGKGGGAGGREQTEARFPCMLQDFWTSVIFASRNLLCLPAFQGYRAKMVST